MNSSDVEPVQSPNEHVCEKIPEKGVCIYFQRFGNSQGASCWTMQASREATEQDLEESHILEEVGEDIWTFTAEISFCPYCGTKLEILNRSIYTENDEVSMEVKTKTEYGTFTLFDQENWNGRLR